MTKINIDMSDPTQYQKEFVTLEPGVYDFTITNRLKLAKAQSSDNQICKVELTTQLDDGTTVKVFDNLVYSPSSQWKWYQFFRALGLSDEEIKEQPDLEDLYQMTLKAKIKQELYKGEPQARVARYLYEGDDSADE